METLVISLRLMMQYKGLIIYLSYETRTMTTKHVKALTGLHLLEYAFSSQHYLMYHQSFIWWWWYRCYYHLLTFDECLSYSKKIKHIFLRYKNVWSLMHNTPNSYYLSSLPYLQRFTTYCISTNLIKFNPILLHFYIMTFNESFYKYQ